MDAFFALTDAFVFSAVFVRQETYFISLTGEIVHKIVLRQQGKEFM